MKIFYYLPGLGPCGGVRIVVEHCNRLAERGHDVSIITMSRGWPDWIDIKVPILNPNQRTKCDVVVATGHQTVRAAMWVPADRYYYFVQMMEHRFYPENSCGWNKAIESYKLAMAEEFKVITIANWLSREMTARFGIDSTILPNGVNMDDFYPEPGQRAEAILVEGDGRNPAKDTEGISWKVALELRKEYGLQLWGYAAATNPYMAQFDRFEMNPSTATMRKLYSKAQFLLKASKYEGRACAPVEAMACGTASARAITKGDDDLINRVNCLRVDYEYGALLHAARSMVKGTHLRQMLHNGAFAYANVHLHWGPIITQLEQILCD